MKSIVATVLALVMLCMAFSACDAQFGLGRRREVQKVRASDRRCTFSFSFPKFAALARQN